MPHTLPVAEMLARNPRRSCSRAGRRRYTPRARRTIDDTLFTAGVPVFGICYGFQLMARGLGGEVAHTGAREYGRTPSRSPNRDAAGRRTGAHNVWMSHGDSVTAAPDGFRVLASTATTPVAAFENVDRGLAGVQWHPEVMHTEHGQQVLEHFLHEIAGCRPQPGRWSTSSRSRSKAVRAQIGDRGQAICGLSGGVDSAVAAAIVQRAIGDRLTCVYVDHG